MAANSQSEKSNYRSDIVREEKTSRRFAREKLIRLYRMKDPVKAKKEEETLRYVSSFYDLM